MSHVLTSIAGWGGIWADLEKVQITLINMVSWLNGLSASTTCCIEDRSVFEDPVQRQQQ